MPVLGEALYPAGEALKFASQLALRSWFLTSVSRAFSSPSTTPRGLRHLRRGKAGLDAPAIITETFEDLVLPRRR
jgi:hypothetical protein